MLVRNKIFIIQISFILACILVLQGCKPKENVVQLWKDYPFVKDSISLVSYLQSTYNLCTDLDDGKSNGEITAFQKFKLNGSDADFYLLEYLCANEGPMSSFPWKHQFVFTERGELLKSFSAIRFQFLNVFPEENPYLLLTISTGKGNGGHELYKLTADSLENVYEGYYNYHLSTYDAHEDISVFDPYELDIKLDDVNNDGYNDLVFTGQIVFLMAKSDYGDVWYHEMEDMPFSKENPAKVVPVNFIFLYDKDTGHFKEYESYGDKNIEDYY